MSGHVAVGVEILNFEDRNLEKYILKKAVRLEKSFILTEHIAYYAKKILNTLR